jgi:hypothetical protein
MLLRVIIRRIFDLWEKELNTIAIKVKELYIIASYLKNQIP